MMANYNKSKNNSDDEAKKRRRIIEIIIIIIIILLLLTSCSSGLFGRIGSAIRDFSSYIIKGGSQETKIIYDEDLKFTVDSGTTSVDDVFRIEFEKGSLGTKDFTCSTSNSKIATCMVRDDYVEVYAKEAGTVEIRVIANANGYKYIGRYYLTVKAVERRIKLDSNSGDIYLDSNKNIIIPVELINLTGKIIVTSSDESVATAKMVNNTLVVTGKSEGEAKITLMVEINGKEYTAAYNVTVKEKKEKDPNVKSNENRLASVSFYNLTLKPDFDKNTFFYNIKTNSFTVSTSMTVRKIEDSETVTYYLNGKKITDINKINLKYGDNVIIISVVSESGISRQYKITINRPKPNVPVDPDDPNKPEDPDKPDQPDQPPVKSNDSTLSYISLSDGSLRPTFDSKVLVYKVAVSNDVEKITVNSAKHHKKATVSYTYDGEEVTNLKDLDLKVGKNVVRIIVTAEDGTSSVYTVNIYRAEKGEEPVIPPNDDNDLSNISVTLVNGKTVNLNPKFNKDITSYEASVDKKTSTVKVVGTLSDKEKATMVYKYKGETYDSLDSITLDYGDNVVVITVTAEDGTQKDYTILINREELDENNLLSNIEISDRDFSTEFDKNTNVYSIGVSSTLDKITIKPTKESENSVMKYYVDGVEVPSLKDIPLHSGNNVVKIEVISEKEQNQENPVPNTYIISIYKPTVKVEFSSEKIDVYMENLVDGKYNIVYKVYEDDVEIDSYDTKNVSVSIPNFKGTYIVHKGYVEIKPSNGDVDNSYKLTLSYLDKKDNIDVNVKMKNYFVNPSLDTYYIDTIDGEGSKTIILNTNLFNNDMSYEKDGNTVILRNDKGYIRIKGNGVKLIFNEDDNKNVTNYISLVLEAINGGEHDITIDAYVYGKHVVDNKVIPVIVTSKYKVTIDAKDGFYNAFTTKYEYVLEEGTVLELDSDTYMAYKSDKNTCTYYKLDHYVDKDGNEYHLGDSITISKTLYLTAIFTEETYDIDIENTGTMYLTEVDIFHNEEYYQKYHKDKIIYPGAKGGHVMNIANNTTGTVKISKLNIDEETHCTNNGCINMAYIVKYIRPQEDHDAYYYGSSNKYTILNKDVPTKKYNSGKGTYTISKSIELGDGIEIEPGQEIEIALLWKWDDSDDIVDTEIGSIETDTMYSITVSIDYSVVDDACAN